MSDDINLLDENIILWRSEPLPSNDLETNNVYSRCYATGEYYNDRF
jgi:hypothetical protein